MVNKQARVIAVANQKGGVGKTTTAINLSAALVRAGFGVLLVDVDPQANATAGLGIELDAGQPSIYQVMRRERRERIPITSIIVMREGIAVAPGRSGSSDLAGLEADLASAVGRDSILRAALEPVRDEFDFIVIDCPPSLTVLTVNALVAADRVLVPLQTGKYALDGYDKLVQTIDDAQTVNPTLKLLGAFLTFVEGTSASQYIKAEAQEKLGSNLLQSEIRRTTAYGESPIIHVSIFGHNGRDAVHRAAEAYEDLAREVVERW